MSSRSLRDWTTGVTEVIQEEAAAPRTRGTGEEVGVTRSLEARMRGP